LLQIIEKPVVFIKNTGQGTNFNWRHAKHEITNALLTAAAARTFLKNNAVSRWRTTMHSFARGGDAT